MVISQGHPNAITSTLSAFKCLLPFPLLLNFSLFYIRLTETFSTLKAESSSLTIPFPYFSLFFSIIISSSILQPTSPSRPGATVDLTVSEWPVFVASTWVLSALLQEFKMVE